MDLEGVETETPQKRNTMGISEKGVPDKGQIRQRLHHERKTELFPKFNSFLPIILFESFIPCLNVKMKIKVLPLMTLMAENR